MLQDVWRPVRLYTFVQKACCGVNLQLPRWLKAFKTCCLPCLVNHSHVTSNFCQACLWCSCKRLSSSPTCSPNTVQYRKKRVFSSVLLCHILWVTAPAPSPTRPLVLFRCLPAPRTCVGFWASVSSATISIEQQIWNCNIDNTESFSLLLLDRSRDVHHLCDLREVRLQVKASVRAGTTHQLQPSYSSSSKSPGSELLW